MTRNLVAAFVISVVSAWSQLGGVAHAQHEPMRAERVEATSPTPRHTHAHDAHLTLQLDGELHRVDGVPGSSHGAHVAGGVSLLVVGGLGVGGGLVLAFIGSLVAHPLCFSESGSCPSHDATGWWVGSGVSGGVGLVSVASGIALLATQDPRNASPVRVVVAPTDGGVYGTVAVEF